MRNSDPRVRMVLVHKLNSDFPVHLYLVGNRLELPKRAQSWCSFGSNFLVQMFLRLSWYSVLTTGHWICELWKFFSVFRHEILSIHNCSEESCISTKFFSLYLVVITFQFVLDIFAIDLLRVQVHTYLRLLRKDWADLQKLWTVSPSAQKCIDSFPTPLLLSWPLDNGFVARKTGCPLSAIVNIISSAILSHSPWTGFMSTTFSLSQDREMTIVLLQIFLHIEKRFEHLTHFLFHCL